MSLRAASPLFALTALVLPSPALSGVVAQWNMDNDFGTVMQDSSGNGNNGTLTNVVTSGSGYIFNGTNAKVVVPHSASLSPGDRTLTYTVVFQTDRMPPVGGDYDLLRKGASSTVGGGFRSEIEYRDGKGVGYCSVSDNAGHTLSARSKVNLVDGKLHTITCTKTATSLTLQIDALPPITKTGILGAITNTKALALGCRSPTCKLVPDDDFFDGVLRSATISLGD